VETPGRGGHLPAQPRKGKSSFAWKAYRPEDSKLPAAWGCPTKDKTPDHYPHRGESPPREKSHREEKEGVLSPESRRTRVTSEEADRLAIEELKKRDQGEFFEKILLAPLPLREIWKPSSAPPSSPSKAMERFRRPPRRQEIGRPDLIPNLCWRKKQKGPRFSQGLFCSKPLLHSFGCGDILNSASLPYLSFRIPAIPIRHLPKSSADFQYTGRRRNRKGGSEELESACRLFGGSGPSHGMIIPHHVTPIPRESRWPPPVHPGPGSGRLLSLWLRTGCQSSRRPRRLTWTLSGPHSLERARARPDGSRLWQRRNSPARHCPRSTRWRDVDDLPVHHLSGIFLLLGRLPQIGAAARISGRERSDELPAWLPSCCVVIL